MKQHGLEIGMLVIFRPDGFSSPDSISLAGIRTVIIVVLHPWELRFYQFPVGRISAGPQNYSLAGMESHGTAILRIYRFGSNDSSIFSDQFCQRRIQKRSAAQFMEPVIQRNNETAAPSHGLPVSADAIVYPPWQLRAMGRL